MIIKRSALRTQVRAEILNRMRAGAVSPGEQINEVQLAYELGVSRTPLREALIALEGEGQIASVSGRGFQYKPLSASEITDLAPVIATLEGLALKLTAPADRRELGVQLAAMAEDFAATQAEAALVNARDQEWHQLMLSRCPNQHLLGIIENVRATIHRYEALLIADEQIIERRTEEHASVAARLIEDDLDGAKAWLTRNWLEGLARILRAAPSADEV